MRFLAFSAAVAALALAGCADSSSPGQLGLGSAPPQPKTVVVKDFTISSDLVVIDHGFSTRLERKAGNYPILERRQRTAARVNDEIVATIVAILREAGLQAQPGSEEGLADRDHVLLVSGRLRAANEGKAVAKSSYGFGPGRSGVVADMTLARFSWGDRKTGFTFTAEGPRTRRAGAALAAKLAKTRDEDIAAALASEDAVAERLSPDVEAQARGLGSAIAEQIVAFARTQGWVSEAPVAAEATPPKKPEKKKKPGV
jgi:hypothetical protein